MIATRLLMGGGGSFTIPAIFPTDWGVTRYPGNPVITNTVAEPSEQYEPAPLELPNGDVWVYVKGTDSIYAYLSTDAGETFTIQNGGAPVIVPATGWSNSFVVEPAVVYDEANGTIHLYAKGRDTNPVNWQWGHWTADDSDPLTFTADPANPILTKANAASDLGGGTLTDLGISDVIFIGGVSHFYGYAEYNGTYQAIQATGTTWNDPSGANSFINAAPTYVVFGPRVFRMPGGGSPIYVCFYTRGTGLVTSSDTGTIQSASSPDGETWTTGGPVVLVNTGSGWEETWAYGGSMLKVSTAPFNLPLVDGLGRWRFYYSGLDDSDHAQSGLAYMEPT